MARAMQTSEKLCWSVAEVSRLLDLSRNGTYQGCLTGQIPCIRIGKRILIPKIQLEKLLSGRIQEGDRDA